MHYSVILWKSPSMHSVNINCNNIAWNETNHIKYLCSLFNMDQLIQEPTRVTPTSKTLIDLILMSMAPRHKNT